MGVTKCVASGSDLERSAKEGDSPVGESGTPPERFLSRSGHVEP